MGVAIFMNGAIGRYLRDSQKRLGVESSLIYQLAVSAFLLSLGLAAVFFSGDTARNRSE